VRVTTVGSAPHPKPSPTRGEGIVDWTLFKPECFVGSGLTIPCTRDKEVL
jgi:hypothetical protein